jgi:hypothetical protein
MLLLGSGTRFPPSRPPKRLLHAWITPAYSSVTLRPIALQHRYSSHTEKAPLQPFPSEGRGVPVSARALPEPLHASRVFLRCQNTRWHRFCPAYVPQPFWPVTYDSLQKKGRIAVSDVGNGTGRHPGVLDRPAVYRPCGAPTRVAGVPRADGNAYPDPTRALRYAPAQSRPGDPGTAGGPPYRAVPGRCDGDGFMHRQP